MTRRIVPLVKIVMSAVAVFVVYAAFRPTNQQLQPTGETFPKYAVSGRVVTSTGAPPRNLAVSAWLGERQAWIGDVERPIRDDGTFALGGLEAGRYLLLTSRAGERDAGSEPVEGGFTTVDVENRDVSGVLITTRPSVDVPARIRYEQPSPGSAPPQVVVHASLNVPGFGQGQGPHTSATAQPDGSLMLYDLFGPRVINYGWSPAGGWHPEAVLLNGKDVSGQPVDFAATPNPQLEVVFARRPKR